MREEIVDLGGPVPGGIVVERPGQEPVLMVDVSLTVRQRTLVIANLLDDDEFCDYIRDNWAVRPNAPSRGARLAAALVGIPGGGGVSAAGRALA